MSEPTPLQPMTYSREDNVSMWNTLTDTQKKGLFKIAHDKFPYLTEHFRFQNMKLSDENFTSSGLFGVLMDLVGRKETRMIKQ